MHECANIGYFRKMTYTQDMNISTETNQGHELLHSVPMNHTLPFL